MITYSALYILAGLLFCVFAWLSLRDTSNPKRFTTALFWGLFAASFAAASSSGSTPISRIHQRVLRVSPRTSSQRAATPRRRDSRMPRACGAPGAC